MDISLIIFLSVLAFFAFRGYKNGLFAVATKLVSYLIAYVVAYIYAQPVSIIVQSSTPVEGLLTYVIAGILLFVVTSIVSTIFFSILSKLFGQESTNSKLSSLGGATLGVFIGVLFGLLSVWLFGTIQELYRAKKQLPPIAHSQFHQSVKNVITSGLKKIVSGISQHPEISAATAAILIDPVENAERYKRLSNSGDLQSLFQKNTSLNALSELNPHLLMQTEPFKKLLINPDFIALAKEFNLPEQPDKMQKEIAVILTTAWAQIQQVKNQPRFIEITQDPDIRKMLETRDVYGLLNNKMVEELLNMVTSVKVANISINKEDPPLKTESNQQLTTKLPEEEPTIYRWVDENGKVHYSDKPKDE